MVGILFMVGIKMIMVLRDDGSKKLWKNQITLVFYDSNPEIGWDLITDEGEDLPLWRYNNDFCNAVAVKKVIRAMIKNMKNPEYSFDGIFNKLFINIKN